MSVHVDDVRYQSGRMVMCHMWADTEAELLAMAYRIGVQRRWIQGHPTLSIGKAKSVSWLHFDISLQKKRRAIVEGALLTDKYGPLEFLAWQDVASGDRERVAYGQAKLESIARCRALPAGDGFADFHEMRTFWIDTHGLSTFEGVVIRWEPLS